MKDQLPKSAGANEKIAELVEQTNIEQLIDELLDQPWHVRCDVIPDYLPPNTTKHDDTRPRVVVCYNNGTEYPAFLRYSKGPKQGFFWDYYGDDMQSVALAIIALSRAPTPVNVAPLIVKFPIRAKEEGE